VRKRWRSQFIGRASVAHANYKLKNTETTRILEKLHTKIPHYEGSSFPPLKLRKNSAYACSTSKKSCYKISILLQEVGPTTKIPTCLDCSSVISSEAFIPFRVISLIYIEQSVRMDVQTTMKKKVIPRNHLASSLPIFAPLKPRVSRDELL
jgi:hypothetical protein